MLSSDKFTEAKRPKESKDRVETAVCCVYTFVRILSLAEEVMELVSPKLP